VLPTLMRAVRVRKAWQPLRPLRFEILFAILFSFFSSISQRSSTQNPSPLFLHQQYRPELMEKAAAE
jgi:hypothetical protein